MTDDIIAPRYRYYTEDLLSGKKLAELDFRGVSYKLALNAAGDFSGSLIVKDVVNATNLYDATLPGLTALYILRDEVCVWGGIIWEREYIPNDKSLSVSASEFTSYLHHRKIWKTWSHEYGATVAFIPESGQWRVALENGSNVTVRSGSTVHIEFYEVDNFRYNGYYRVALSPKPTTKEFYITGGSAVADVIRVESDGTTIFFYTREKHGFNTDDTVTIDLTQLGNTYTPGLPILDQTAKIAAPGGPNSNMFSLVSSALAAGVYTAGGTAMRPLPEGVYQRTTIGVRQDTFDYVRSLIEATFNDFVGTDFPNVYIEPGISTALDVVSKQSFGGYSIVKTAEPHNIAVGQAVQIQDVGPEFDGEFEVTGVEYGSSIVYVNGGDFPETPVAPFETTINGFESLDGVTTVMLYSSPSEGLSVGQNVLVNMGPNYPELSGTFKITEVPASGSFKVLTGSKIDYPYTEFQNVTANGLVIDTTKIENNKAIISTVEPNTFNVGDNVTIQNSHRRSRVVERSHDGPSGVSTIQTEGAHGMMVGSSVVLSGLSDVVYITSVVSSTSTTSFNTSVTHNLRVGDSIRINGSDVVNITNKQISSNTAILSTSEIHNFQVGDPIEIRNLIDVYSITDFSLVDDVATIVTGSPHSVEASEMFSVGSISDEYQVITRSVQDGNVVLTTRYPHNVYEGQKIQVTGVGEPFDGEATVSEITDQRIMYQVDSKYINVDDNGSVTPGTSVPISLPEQKVTGGMVTSPESYLVGDWRATAVTPNTIKFARGGNDYTRGSTPAAGLVSVLSGMCGLQVITAATPTTLRFSYVAANSPNTPVPQPVDDEDIQATIEKFSVYGNLRVVTSTTPFSFSANIPVPYAVSKKVSLTGTVESVMNGTRVITSVPTRDRFTFSNPTITYSMFEQTQSKGAWAEMKNFFDGTFVITDVSRANQSFSFAKVYNNLPAQGVQGFGKINIYPLVVTSTFGPYPGNADIQFVFPDIGYSGTNIEPALYRGFELKTVGEALDEYSNNINGFEYRIDCEYVKDEDRFIKKFVLIPIDFPNAPQDGEPSPLSRFGADKLVFEYPAGSVSSFSIRESAEEASTRFFALGENELGPDVGPYIGVASADDLLRGTRDGRKWPLLDASDTVDGIDDKTVLYAYAKRFLSELQPPFASFQIVVNGSRSPFVGSYKPGDWCSIVVDDPWMQMRLESDLEPRSDVLVRKIDSISVSVPDGVTYPESVVVNLVAEWEVDKRG